MMKMTKNEENHENRCFSCFFIIFKFLLNSGKMLANKIAKDTSKNQNL